MSAVTVALLFGISCADPCAAQAPDLRLIEQEVRTLLITKGFTVKPAPSDAKRPTGEASLEPVDEAGKHRVDRVVVLDLEASGNILWISQFVAGIVGPWGVDKVVCVKGEGGVLECPSLSRGLLAGLRPRLAKDVDLISALRAQATKVGACVQASDEVPVAERIFGRVEMTIGGLPTGEVRVVAIAPAVASRSPIGTCLKQAMEAMNVGPYEGQPIPLRIPVDL